RRRQRGGVVLWDDEALTGKLNSGVFPGVQGSVMLNSVAAKAVCLGEALRPEFKAYADAVLANARVLAKALVERGVDVVTGGTDTPLLLVDLRVKGLTGAKASDSLERALLTCNKNGVPGDTQPPTVTSGLRFGVSAGTTRGMGTAEFETIGHLIADVLDGLAGRTADQAQLEARVAAEVRTITERFPIYGGA
ncbi:MAG: serine hydroxymethyltransferase, partial [Rhodospirillaceae bacterium]